MAQPLIQNLRIVFSISDILPEVQLPSSTLKLLLCDTTKTIQLPCNKPASLDFPQVQLGSKIEFDLEDPAGNVYGYSELPVPEAAFYNREIQVNQQIHFYLNNAQKEFISAKIFIIFLNAEVTLNSRHSNSISRLSSKLSIITAKGPNKSFSSPQKPNESVSQKKVQDRQLINTFVDNLFNQFSQDIGNLSRRQCDSNNQSLVMGSRSALSPQASFDTLNGKIDLISPIQVFTPKNPISTRDHYSSVNSTMNEICNLDTTNRNRGPTSTARTSSAKKYKDDKTSSRKPSNDSQQSSLADFRNQISLIHKNRSSSQAEKESRSYAINIHQAVQNNVVNNSITADNGADQVVKLATFCPNSVNQSNRDKPAENHNQISAEKLREKFKEKILQEEKKAANKKRNPSSSPGVDKRNCLAKSSHNTELNALKTQVEQLQKSVKAKDSQLEALESLKKENIELKVNLKRLEEVREMTCEITEEDKVASRQLETQISELSSEKQGLMDKNSELMNRIEELERLVVEKMGRSIVSESQNLQLGLEIKDLKNVKEHYEKMQVSSENVNQRLQEERAKFAEALSAMQKDMQEVKGIVSRLTKEKRDMQEELMRMQTELTRERTITQELKDELCLTQKSCAFAESYKLVVESLETEKQDLMKMLFERKKGQTELQGLLESNTADFKKQLEFTNVKESQYVSQISQLKQELKSSDEKVSQLTVQLAGMKLKVTELLQGESNLEQIVSLNKNIERQLEASNSRLVQAVTEKEKLSERMLGLLQEQETLSARFAQGENTVERSADFLNEREDVEKPKKTGASIEEAMYIPCNDDPVDFALAKFINLRNDIQKMKVLFVRENRGIYQFGTKRVYIKLEGDKIIVRVGGGYLAVEEFLNQYMQVEYEKLIKNGLLHATMKHYMVNKSVSGKSPSRTDKKKSSGSFSRDASPTKNY